MTREGMLARSEKRRFILRPKHRTATLTSQDVHATVQ
jgi:hypothetical protein